MFGLNSDSAPVDDIYLPDTRKTESDVPGILIMTAHGTEDIEFFYPYYRFIEAGYRVDVATPDGSEFAGKHGLGLKKTLKITDMDEADYALLYIPGGKAPEALKKIPAAVQLVRDFADVGKPIAAVCHGPQLLAAAGIIDGARISAWPGVQSEVEDAGATYIDAETVNDGIFTTARWPGDLPSYMRYVLHILAGVSSSRIVAEPRAA